MIDTWLELTLDEWLGMDLSSFMGCPVTPRTQRTPSKVDTLTYYGLFRKDAQSITAESALRDQVFTDIVSATQALSDLVRHLPKSLKSMIVIQQIPTPVVSSTADRWYVALD